MVYIKAENDKSPIEGQYLIAKGVLLYQKCN